MLISDIIETIDELRPGNSYTDTQKIKWISNLDKKLRTEVIKEYGVATISRVQDQAAYSLPDGVTFNYISKVFVDGHPISKIDVTSYQKRGYWLDSEGLINFHPTPTATDTEAGIRIIYLTVPDTYVSTTQEVLAPEPYSEMYEWYILSKMDISDRRYKDYNNSVAIFNSKLEEFTKFYIRQSPTEDIVSKNYF